MLKLGNINISKVYIGSTPAPKGFLGEVQVWGQSTPVETIVPDFVVNYFAKSEGETLNVVQDVSHNIDKVGRYNSTTGQYEVIEFPAEGIVVDENEPFQYGFTLKNKTKMSVDDFMFKDFSDGSPNVAVLDLHSLDSLTTLYGSTTLYGGEDPNTWHIYIPNTIQRFEEACCEGVTVKVWDNGDYRYGLPSGVTYIEGSENDYGNGCFSWSKLWDGENEYDFVIPASVTHLGVGAFMGAWLPSTIRINSTVNVPNACFDMARCGDANWGEDPMGTVVIYIAEGNTSIGTGAFYLDGQTFGISSISFPSTLRTIGEGAFSYDQFLLSEDSYPDGLILPDGLTTIGGGAFEGCYNAAVYEPLKVVIPSSVTTIGGAAFKDAEIEEIHINSTTPATLRNDYESFEGSYPFDECQTREDEETHLRKPTPLYVPCEAVDAYKTAWSMYEDRISCQRDYMTPEFVVYYEKEDDTRDFVIFNPALVNLVDKIGVNDGTGWAEYDVPSDGIFSQDIINNGGGMLGIKLKTSTALDTSLFDSTDFREIDGGGMSLDTAAPWTRVYNSKNGLIESLQPEGTQLLIDLPNTVQRVEDYGCAGLNLSIPDGSGNYKQDFPSSLTYIGDYAFYCGNMLYDSLNIPAGVTYLGEYALATGGFGVDLNVNSAVGIPEGFNDSNYFVCENLVIANGNTFIGDNAFRSCHFSGVSLPNTLQTIGDYAFEFFVNESSDGYGSGITIPASVTSIGSYAFNGALLPAIYFEGATPATIGDDVFTDCMTPDNTPTPIYVPCEAVDAYKAAAGWSTYADRIQCIPSPEPPEASEYFHFISLKNGSQVKANSKFQYSLDGGNTWTAGDNAMKTLNSGNTIYFKGVNTTALGQDPFGTLFQSALSPTKLEVRGNIMSLCYGDHFEEYTTILANGFFKRLFGSSDTDNPTLVRADKLYLPSTTLTSECYAEMFRHCNVLRTAPSLPATTLAANCYDKMFANCTSLTTAPSELPATTLEDSCYYQMFARCTSLTTAPTISATVLSENCCYDMFFNCTSLKKAPALPATTLAKNCYYNMFYNCTSLTGTPELPATTLAENCYMGMFDGCSGLTSASTLSATTLAKYCYRQMFYDCASLVTAPNLPATTLANYCYYQMFWRCTSLTSIPSILPATTLANGCYSGMFGGCTGVTTAPELPATTLTASCYENMFNGCTSLSVAPELPAITLVEKCYGNMFKNCGNINYIKAMFTTEPSSSYTENWLYNAFPVGTFVKNSAATWDVRGANGIPEGWTVETADA